MSEEDNFDFELSEDNCPICNFEDTENLEKELAKGLPKTVVADDMDCDVEEIRYHMEKHFTTGEEASLEEAEDENLEFEYMIQYQDRESYEKFDVLEKNMHRLTDRFDELLQGEGEITKDTTEQVVKMAREIRQTATSMASLEGEIKEELRLTEEQFHELKAAILRELDEEDQKKILNILEEKRGSD